MEFLYEWTKNLAFYLLIVTVILQILPNQSYKKYIRFFIGLILIMMLIEPVMRIFDLEQQFHKFYEDAQRQQEKLERIWMDE